MVLEGPWGRQFGWQALRAVRSRDGIFGKEKKKPFMPSARMLGLFLSALKDPSCCLSRSHLQLTNQCLKGKECFPLTQASKYPGWPCFTVSWASWDSIQNGGMDGEMMEFAATAKLTTLIRENTTSTFIVASKTPYRFFYETEKVSFWFEVLIIKNST